MLGTGERRGFTMRNSYEGEARETRTLTDLFTDAVVLIRQDAAEYGFTAVLGAIGGAVAVVMLGTAGGPIGRALMAPAAFLAALLTYATACAAIRRVEENLSPDTLSAFAAVCQRAAAVVTPALGPLGIVFAGLLAAGFIDRYVGQTVGTLAGLCVVGGAAIPVFRRALYVPALFTHSSNARDAADRAARAQDTASAALFVLHGAALVPALLFGLIALGTGFTVMSSALASFVFVMTMPLSAAISTLILDRVAPAAAMRASAAKRHVASTSPVTDRLTRIRR